MQQKIIAKNEELTLCSCWQTGILDSGSITDGPNVRIRPSILHQDVQVVIGDHAVRYM